MSRLVLGLALSGLVTSASWAPPAAASPWVVSTQARARDTPESLLEQAQQAYDQGHYREAGDLAAAAYAALPLANRASPYGENAVLQAIDAYREAWLRKDDPAVLTAGRELLERHLADYTEHGRREAPGAIQQELERMRRLEERCQTVEPQPEESEVTPTPSPPATPGRALRRGTTAAFVGDAALGLGAALLSSFTFGYEQDPGDPQVLVQTRSIGHLVPALPLGLAAGVVGGLGMHARVDGGAIPAERRRTIGVGLTVAGAAAVVVGGVLLGTGAAFWPAPENGVTSRSRAGWSVNLQSIGLGTMLGALGILGPGIGALATPGSGR